MTDHDAEVRALVKRFERGTLPLAEWDHAAHLAVATYYLSLLGEIGPALSRTRAGILRFNALHGIEQRVDSGYHETLTVCFVRLVAARLAEPGAPSGLADRVAWVQERLQDERVVLEHYSRPLINSWDARTGWVEPDLRPLPAHAPTTGGATRSAPRA